MKQKIKSLASFNIEMRNGWANERPKEMEGTSRLIIVETPMKEIFQDYGVVHLQS